MKGKTKIRKRLILLMAGLLMCSASLAVQAKEETWGGGENPSSTEIKSSGAQDQREESAEDEALQSIFENDVAVQADGGDKSGGINFQWLSDVPKVETT